MKAMILAAGRGERMRPLTDATPKPLLKVVGKMLIEYHLENLALAGITEVVINHAWLGKQLPVALGDGHAYGINIVYSDEGDTALETAGGIVNALDLLGDDPFIVVNGDIWTDYDFCQLNNRPDCQSMHLVLVDNPAHHPQGDFCLNSDGLVVEQNEAPSLTYSGIGIYSPELFTKLKTDVLPLAPLIREAISRQQVSGEHYQGQWWDIGTPARLDELDKALREQN